MTWTHWVNLSRTPIITRHRNKSLQTFECPYLHDKTMPKNHICWNLLFDLVRRKLFLNYFNRNFAVFKVNFSWNACTYHRLTRSHWIKCQNRCFKLIFSRFLFFQNGDFFQISDFRDDNIIYLTNKILEIFFRWAIARESENYASVRHLCIPWMPNGQN
jgi:hypothetical protein